MVFKLRLFSRSLIGQILLTIFLKTILTLLQNLSPLFPKVNCDVIRSILFEIVSKIRPKILVLFGLDVLIFPPVLPRHHFRMNSRALYEIKAEAGFQTDTSNSLSDWLALLDAIVDWQITPPGQYQSENPPE